MSNGPMFFIFGPTGTGKTDLALRIAECIPAKIVSMDIEMQKELSFGEKTY